MPIHILNDQTFQQIHVFNFRYIQIGTNVLVNYAHPNVVPIPFQWVLKQKLFEK